MDILSCGSCTVREQYSRGLHLLKCNQKTLEQAIIDQIKEDKHVIVV